MWEVELPPAGTWADLAVPEGHNAIAFGIRGEVAVQAEAHQTEEGQVAVLGQAWAAPRIGCGCAASSGDSLGLIGVGRVRHLASAPLAGLSTFQRVRRQGGGGGGG